MPTSAAAERRPTAQAGERRFRAYASGVLIYNVVVVLWGALVRATGSGAGCGDRWPLCNGVVVPRSPVIETIIEFTHRVMSGVSLAAVALLLVLAFRIFPRRHAARRAAAFSALFLILEALLGAGLVLLNYVDKNASIGRVFYLAAHLTNTQLLLGSLAATAWAARSAAPRLSWSAMPPLIRAALITGLAVCVTGAIAALGDTLFPAASLAAGMRQDFSSASSLLLRLRLAHPIFAVLAGAFLAYAVWPSLRLSPDSTAGRLALGVICLVVLQACCGAVNVVLLAPVWIQIVHLLLADALWIALVFLALESAATRASTAGA